MYLIFSSCDASCNTFGIIRKLALQMTQYGIFFGVFLRDFVRLRETYKKQSLLGKYTIKLKAFSHSI